MLESNQSECRRGTKRATTQLKDVDCVGGKLMRVDVGVGGSLMRVALTKGMDPGDIKWAPEIDRD